MASPVVHTFPGAHVLHVLAVARSWNITGDQLLDGFGVVERELEDPSFRVPLDMLSAICERARQLTGEPGFGFHLGLRKRASMYGQLGFASMSAATLREVAELAVRFTPIITSALGLALELDGERAALRVDQHADFGSAQDIAVFSFVVGLRQVGAVLTGRQPGRIRIDIPFDKPAYFDRFAHLLPGARFGYAKLRVHFPRGLLDFPLQTPDRAALRAAQQVCERQLAELGTSAELAPRVRRLVLTADSVRSIDAVARALHMSARTLKRKLAVEGTSFSVLVEDERRERALQLLQRSDATLETIAARLGYATVPSFARAFRRWTGNTPAQQRMLRR
jgi:AraC-like DNA-binding protein